MHKFLTAAKLFCPYSSSNHYTYSKFKQNSPSFKSTSKCLLQI